MELRYGVVRIINNKVYIFRFLFMMFVVRMIKGLAAPP